MGTVIRLNAGNRQHDLTIKEFQGQRVVTFRDVDELHQRPNGTARKRFNDNKNRLIHQVDYFVLNSDEAKNEFSIIAPNGLVLLTESGYLMLVKSFTDNLAWQIQRELVNVYFRAKETFNKSELSPLLQVLINLELGQKQLEERTERVERTLTLVKDTIIQTDPDWRKQINTMLNRISKAAGDKYQDIKTESYRILEERARCDLNTRLRNLRERLLESGASKTTISKANRLDVIENDTRLKEIYTAIVKEMTIKYVA